MSEKMNVLFIITDAQRYDHLGCNGNSVLKTPNIDRLAKEGVRFTNYFCTNPICMPNRATLMTGVYPNVHGVRSNGINLREDTQTITKSLKKRGWHTAAIGKIHHQFWMAPFKRKALSAENLASWVDPKGRKDPVRDKFPDPYYGYDEVEVVVGNGTICSGHYIEWLEEKSPNIAERVKEQCLNYDNLFSLFCDGIPEEYYNTSYVKERTLAFLDRFAKGDYGKKPFYLHCSFPDPHYPIYPPGKYQNMYKPEDIELPKNFGDIDNLYSHPYLGQHLKNPPFKKAFLRESSEEEVRKITALTYASIGYVDACVGQILASLEKHGLADNTIVIFTSDHGDLMGDHGMLFKGPCPFNGVLQLPLIWKVPDMTKPGSVSNSLVSSIDYPKTILNLLGIKERHHPPDMQGLNITPILKDPEVKLRDCCFVENDEEVGTLKSRLRHLITEDYKVTIYESMPGYGDIYHRKNDPNELHNLWYDKDFREKRFELVDKLLHQNLKAQTPYPKRIAGT
ncbi:MAG: sulfatase-like hydrolase/transferase [Candidatus Lokiarchaeota archaeon]|nr:sulfatase-like hydrolase/transferase [Candidatus Lokiarchaeota archaeon]MBD3337458.1 sulfatase-like hydrolase/transferase [Candidatus Lokiarchaeota archaeon]